MSKATGGVLSKGFFTFLEELGEHNEREWFNAHKARYEKDVRDPFPALLGKLEPALKKVSKHFVVDPRPVGGSMMRIYRDTRFSKDKTPYKTNMAAHFSHAKGKEGASPGLYLNLSPGDNAVGSGLWHPEPAPLEKLRKAIVSDSKAWGKVRDGSEFKSACGFIGDALKRPPAGFPKEHPYLEDLKRKDFAVRVELRKKDLLGPDAVDAILAAYKTAAPFTRFVCGALELEY